MDEYIRRQDAVGVIEKEMKNYVSDIWYKSATHSALNDVNENIKSIKPANVVSTEPQEIGYNQCADAMLKMWIDNVVTDGEYNRIMDRLNKIYFSGGKKKE